ncbi:MAG: dipeptidase [Planctomycetia bacterium]
MLIFDAHLDISWNAIDWKRDLEKTVPEIRESESGQSELGRATNTVCYPEMRQGNIGVCVATVLARLQRPGNPQFGYATPAACYAVAQGQFAYYRARCREGKMRMLTTKAELADHVGAWNRDPAHTPFGFILSMEGADPVLDPDNIFDWWNDGLRAVGLPHYGFNRYGGGTKSEEGLTPDAYPLLKNIESLKMVLDLTHLSDKAFFQAADAFGGRVLASHQNSRKYVDDQRQFSDEQLKIVIERDGVVGAALDAWMLQPNWIRGESKPTVTMERVVDNIDHVCQLAGHARAAAIGSDLDGGYGTEQTPADLDTIADLQKIPPLLEKRGYSAADVAGIMHGNWLRLFGETLPD